MINQTAPAAPRIALLTLAFLAIGLGLGSWAYAQDPPLNMSEVSNFDQSGQLYADVWGEGDFAYLAHFGQPRVDIIDISVPSDPQLAATFDTSVGSAQDVKVGDGLMFVGLESASPGVLIVDVRDPYQPQKLTNVTVRNAVHNVFYHEGWLYIVDSSSPQIDLVDLRSYDPDNPPTTISEATWTLSGVGSFVHDITVTGNLLIASAWSSVRVFDITNIANQPPVFLTSASGTAVHSAWATEDLKYLVTAEERTGGGLTLFEIVDTEQPGALSLVKRDTFSVPTSKATSVHNPVIRDYTIFASWYQVGVQVLEIDPTLGKLSLVASFDTTAANGNTGFTGCWGVYPFLGDQRVLASDTNTGLWVLEADLQAAPNLTVTGSCPGTVTVDITGATPNKEVGIVSAANTNGFQKGGKLCNGTVFEVGEPFVLPPTFLHTDADGKGSTTMTLESGACWVEAMDFESCKTTNAAAPN